MPSSRGTDDNPNQRQEISRIRKQNVVKEMVGLGIQKKISDVWTVFEKIKYKDGKVLAKCSLCGNLFNGSSKQGTTRLRLHFNSCQRKRNEGGASGRGDKPAGNSVTDQQLNHLDRVRTCIKDKNVLSDLGIDNKISSMVTDGDSDIYVPSSDERENRLSCQGSLLSNCKFCVLNFRDIERTCPNFDEEMEGALCDHISKILNYIAKTSSKTGTFRTAIGRARSLGKEVIAEHIPTEEMLENMSWFDLLPIALGLKEAFFELENMDLHFKSINLTKEQWDVITKFDRFCDEENDFDEIDWDSIKTANMYFPMLCRMYKKSLLWVTLDAFISGEIYLPFVRDAEKCWEQSNLILAVAAVLDPRFKLDTVEHWYKKIYGDECETQRATFMNYLIGVYNEYAEGTNNSQSSTSGSKEKKSSISYTMLDISGNSYNPDSGQSNNFELNLYLNWVTFPLFDDFDILEWWRDNSQYFPTLAKMARDFLPIKVTVPFDNKFL